MTASSSRFVEFAGFDPLGDAERGKLLDAAAQFAGAMESAGTPYSLTLIGPSGIGKTHLARSLATWAKTNFPAIYAHGVRQRPRVTFISAQSACQRYLEGEYDLPEFLKGEDVLVLDDIGTERDPKQTFRTEIQAILDRRVGAWTVITSNLGYKQLLEYDARTASRLIRNGGVVVHSKATDYNLEKMRAK